jgi:hypothetical protein
LAPVDVRITTDSVRVELRRPACYHLAWAGLVLHRRFSDLPQRRCRAITAALFELLA